MGNDAGSQHGGSPAQTAGPVVLTGLLHGGIALALLAVLVYVVPDFVEMYRDVCVGLPASTVALVRLSDFCKVHFVPVTAFVAVLLALDVVAYSRLRARGATRTPSTLWCLGVAGALLLCAMWMVVSMFLPFVAHQALPEVR